MRASPAVEHVSGAGRRRIGIVVAGSIVALLAAAPAVAQELPPPALPAPPTEVDPDDLPPGPEGAPPGIQEPQPEQIHPARPGPAPVYHEPPPAAVVAPAPARDQQPFAFYGELLGKGFLYGVGVDYNFNKMFGIGALFSYYRLFDLRVGVIAPYVNFYPAGGLNHALLIQAGPQIILAAADSVSWSVFKDEKYVMGQVSIGYEFRSAFLFRGGLSVLFTEGTFLPWPGFAFGGAF